MIKRGYKNPASKTTRQDDSTNGMFVLWTICIISIKLIDILNFPADDLIVFSGCFINTVNTCLSHCFNQLSCIDLYVYDCVYTIIESVIIAEPYITYENIDQILTYKLHGPMHYKIVIYVYTMDTCSILCCNNMTV